MERRSAEHSIRGRQHLIFPLSKNIKNEVSIIPGCFTLPSKMNVTKGDVLQILKREIHELVDNPLKTDYIDYESLKKLLNCCKL